MKVGNKEKSCGSLGVGTALLNFYRFPSLTPWHSFGYPPWARGLGTSGCARMLVCCKMLIMVNCLLFLNGLYWDGTKWHFIKICWLQCEAVCYVKNKNKILHAILFWPGRRWGILPCFVVGLCWNSCPLSPSAFRQHFPWSLGAAISEYQEERARALPPPLRYVCAILPASFC